MLFQASILTGDPIYRDIAVKHADTTLANHFRDDYSSYHVVDYDPKTDDVRMKCTAQGIPTIHSGAVVRRGAYMVLRNAISTRATVVISIRVNV